MEMWSFFFGRNKESCVCICPALADVTLFQQMNSLDLSACKALSQDHLCICRDLYTAELGYWHNNCQAKHHKSG